MEAESVAEVGGTSKPELNPSLERTLLLAIFCLAILIRLFALRADNYLRLDWSAALLTDEGFYAHNARNVALFGTARTDGFNNMLVSPILHGIQVLAFWVIGPGMLQARLISVVSSLVGLGAFWLALRKAFGSKIALMGVMFLALDHVNALYSRMALMDTPAAALACITLLLFVMVSERSEDDQKKSVRLLGLVGLVLGLTMVTRNLAIYLIVAPLAGMFVKGDWRRQIPWIAGWAGVMLCYALFWYMPNSAELGSMNHYYRVNQVQPHSVRHLLENIQHAFFGDFRGITPYLFRHSPMLLIFAFVGLGAKYNEASTAVRTKRFLAAWLLAGWAMLSVISYSPSRYYVTLYPALCALAAVGLWGLPELFRRSNRDRQMTGGGFTIGKIEWVFPAIVVRMINGLHNKWAILFGALIGFQSTIAIVHYGGNHSTIWLSVGTIIGSIALPTGLQLISSKLAKFAPAACLGIWALINLGWTGDWLTHLSFTQAEFSQELGRVLPKGSVLIGDVAPGITMENNFKAIHVQPGLVNDNMPVETFAGEPRYIAILDGRWKEKWWVEHYPELVKPERRMILKRVLKWDIGIYQVN